MPVEKPLTGEHYQDYEGGIQQVVDSFVTRGSHGHVAPTAQKALGAKNRTVIQYALGLSWTSGRYDRNVGSEFNLPTNQVRGLYLPMKDADHDHSLCCAANKQECQWG